MANFYQIVYSAVLSQEQRRLVPLTEEEIVRGLGVPISGPWIENQHPEIAKAVEDAQREARHQRTVW